MEKVPEIVLTGGPCAGKTSALSFLQEKLSDWSFRPFVVPEAATMFISGGVPDIGRIAREDAKKFIEFQRQILLMHLAQRKKFQDLANIFKGEKRVLFCDRGGMDGAAYMEMDYFRAILKEERLTLHDVRDSYEAVLHLVTAADGAENFYTTANNKARRETKEEARETDRKTLQAWFGHPHLRIIDNSTDFEGKLRRVIQNVARALGIPVPLEIERKFLLRQMPDFSHPLLQVAQKILIEQVYLRKTGEGQLRIRKRSQEDSATYYKTAKVDISPLVRQETESFINAVDYLHLLRFRDPETSIVKKFRYCFVYKNQYFELDLVFEPIKIVLLEIELTEENDRLALPPFLDIEKEVTADKNYSNYAIAHRAK